MDINSLYLQAISYVQQYGDASCAGLQRNLNIGYSAACKLRAMLDKNGMLPIVESNEESTQRFE